MEFVKMQSAGNDYIYIDGSKIEKLDLPSLAINLSKRRFSVGADGIISVSKISNGAVIMKMFNADGTEGAMCGNGVRCSAVFAKKFLGVTAEQITVKTSSKEVVVDIKNLSYPTALLGVVNEVFTSRFLADKFVKSGLYVDYHDIFSFNVGNLHLVLFTEKPLNEINETAMKSRLFEDGVNVERVYKIDESNLSLPILYTEVFERGSGKTLSCGSGAVAVSKAYLMKKYGALKSGITVTVLTEGGELKVFFKGENAYLSGEVKQIYRGIIDEI
ncbi:MAG: diaminopimelate epimerase [Clostridiales bacterium]|nr:diaminopimelate epimerase [Clostridiales bacterium]